MWNLYLVWQPALCWETFVTNFKTTGISFIDETTVMKLSVNALEAWQLAEK